MVLQAPRVRPESLPVSRGTKFEKNIEVLDCSSGDRGLKTTGAQNGYNYLYNVNHGNEFDRSNITERQLVKPW